MTVPAPNFPTPLVLRQSTERDLPTIADFYVNNKDDYVVYREFDRLADTIRQRRFFLIEDAERNIVAVSAILDFQGRFYRQAGGTRVTSAYGGYDLHHLMHYARAVHVHVVDTDYKAYFTAIHETNARSIENAKAVGFIEWKAGPAITYDWMRTRKEHVFFMFPKENLSTAANCLLNGEVVRKRVNRHTSTEELVTVTFRLESLLHFRPEVERLATGEKRPVT